MSEVKQRGRPSISITYPESGEFGIRELAALNPKISKVTLQQKVNREVTRKTLQLGATRKSGKGRPSQLFVRS